MRKFVIIIFILFLSTISVMLFKCSDQSENKDYMPGPNGEPPKSFKLVYSKQFIAAEKNYVMALGIVHTFSIENKFYPVYTQCLNDVLDVRVTAIIGNKEKTFPCIVVRAEKGVPLKTYLIVTIDDVKFQLASSNRLMYTVSMYGRDGDVGVFKAGFEPELDRLSSVVASKNK